MKIYNLLYAIPVFLLAASCNQQPKHPQADLIKQASATAMTDKSILRYTDSISANLSGLEKQSSLVYLLGTQSMYVEKYSFNGKPVVYLTQTNDEPIGNTIKKYYFKNDSLILVQESIRSNKPLYTDTRTYLRNNIAFKTEQRNAATSTALSGSSYQNLNKDNHNAGKEQDYKSQVQSLDDAIAGINQFAMVFDQFISLPEESVIRLKGKTQNGYSSSVLVRTSDSLIDSLRRFPATFKNEKLNIKWKIEGEEAVYVPVAAKVTSARGLNK